MSDGCAVAPCVELGWGIHRLYWAESPCLIAVYYAVVLPDLLFGEGIDITFLLCASRRTVCFSYPWPSQQFQQRIERLVLGSVEETLRVLLEFLALAKAQGDLVLLTLEVRWWAQADLGGQPQPPCGLLEALFVGAELRIPRLAQQAAHALELLWAGKLRLGKQD